MSTRTDILTPAARLVQGSLYKPNTTDAEGKPLVNKSGPNIGQPRVEFYFAVAIPKGGEQHWSQTAWGAVILGVGREAFPQAHQAPTFAWKVKDGDSTVPNRRGKRPCDSEGFPGHWVLSFSSGYAPGVFRDNGTVPLTTPDAVKLGDWVQVFGSVGGNGSQTQPGVFLNHSMVNFVATGERIVVGPDAASVGFGVAALPAGATALPPAGAVTAAGAPAFPAPVAQFPGTPVAAVAAPLAVQPHPGFLAPAPVGAAMPMPPALPVPAVPPAAPARQMTAKAGGASYEAFIEQGWTDATLVQHGYMVA